MRKGYAVRFLSLYFVLGSTFGDRVILTDGLDFFLSVGIDYLVSSLSSRVEYILSILSTVPYRDRVQYIQHTHMSIHIHTSAIASR